MNMHWSRELLFGCTGIIIEMRSLLYMCEETNEGQSRIDTRVDSHGPGHDEVDRQTFPEYQSW
jgi:hypothetical protein